MQASKAVFFPFLPQMDPSPASPSLASLPAPLQRAPDHSEVCYVSFYSLEILSVTLRILPKLLPPGLWPWKLLSVHRFPKPSCLQSCGSP